MQKAETDLLAALPPAADKAAAFARLAFDCLDKRKLRATLYDEQGALCVYCERRVAEGHPSPRIDHWRPLAANPDLALHWRNLYLSCASETTCDCRKHDSPFRADDRDPDLPWPVEHPYERCVGFTSLGEIYVRSDAPLDDAQRQALKVAVGVPHDKETNDNGTLNLNHPAIVAARAAAVDSERSRLRRDYKDARASQADRDDRSEQLLRERPLKEFVSIRVRWLTQSLGKAR
ncbi:MULTISPECIES: hypothetical protein [Paraburkholderia]|uniref:TIGR02646 family protein n=1 Tax=Paraburkholderia podalyriae TaxID=1938811 RepID=A0ABR7PFE5_9BURK|nr:hypothetical protein [Paraburkholderia podalyriae]MBC8745098.1 hypothetical protein [Paraburkholderia podalyriae]